MSKEFYEDAKVRICADLHAAGRVNGVLLDLHGAMVAEGCDDGEGELLREKWFKVPYYCMMHDFGITEDYLVLYIVPSIGSWERLEKGLPHFGFDTTMPVYLGVIPRRDDVKQEDIRWFKRGNCFASHVLNAWQEGSKIHFLIPEAKNNFFPFFPDVHGEPFKPMESLTFLTDWTVDMASNSDEFDAITPLTQTPADADVFLCARERFYFTRKFPAVIQALEASEIILRGSLPADACEENRKQATDVFML